MIETTCTNKRHNPALGDITIRCSCGNYTADFTDQGVAESAASMHAILGVGHVITATIPAHGKKGAVGMILFTVKNVVRP